MPMDQAELFSHVKDTESFHLPGGVHVDLPSVTLLETPEMSVPGWFDVPAWRLELQLTRFMVLELIVAVAMIVMFVALAWRIRGGRLPRGRLWNMLEVMLLFVRDRIARPAIGSKDADRFLPFLWTVFFFILFCNLIGLAPWAGSPTGSFSVTTALAVVTLATVVVAGTRRYGLVRFWTGMVPPMEVPLVMAIFIKPMLFVIEVVGLLIRHFVLSMRLLANMFAGHLVLAVVLSFIAAAAGQQFLVWSGVTISSIFGATALSLLELFVAFLQAYIFAFLAALFIGMAIHQH